MRADPRTRPAARRDRPLPLVLPKLRRLPARGDLRGRRLRQGSGLAGLQALLRQRRGEDLQGLRHPDAGGVRLTVSAPRRSVLAVLAPLVLVPAFFGELLVSVSVEESHRAERERGEAGHEPKKPVLAGL